MGFRFRKSIKLFPGVRINLSKTGISTSVGVPGATVNLRGDKTTTTVGLPGTGVSYRSTIGSTSGQSTQHKTALFWVLIALAVIFILHVV